MPLNQYRTALLSLLVAAVCVLPGCKTLQEIAALRDVDFALDRVAGIRLAGIDLSSIRSFDDLSIIDTGRLVASAAAGNMPLEMTVHVAGQNPAENSVSARLVRLDWSLFIDQTETISGIVDNPIDMPPGQTVDIPVAVRMNLIDFFDRGAQDLVNLIGALAGQSDSPSMISLRASPTVNTPLGPMRYPQPITIISKTVGS